MQNNSIKNISVIGLGVVGGALAKVIGEAGYTVNTFDKNQDGWNENTLDCSLSSSEK